MLIGIIQRLKSFTKFLVEVAREPVRDFCAQVQKKSWERNAH